MKHVHHPVPSKVKLFMDFESDEPLPDFLISESVTLSRFYVETSVIASPLDEEANETPPANIDDSDSEDSKNTVDIPITYVCCLLCPSRNWGAVPV